MTLICRRVYRLLVMLLWLAAPAYGLSPPAGSSAGAGAPIPDNEPPDTPAVQLHKTFNSLFGVTKPDIPGEAAKRLDRIIEPGETGVPLNSADKFELAVMSRITPADITATVFSAGWSHLRDSAPHYGTDSGAFGERLGALALKQTTQSIFGYGIYASLLHDDPRYYVMGRKRKVATRAVYAASRLVITQRDSGKSAINWPEFAGIASSTALTNAYYPTRDHGFANGAEAFGVSLGTSILDNEFHEFIEDAFLLISRHRN